MIDTMGFGIHRMNEEQRNRYFPLPDYSTSTRDRVILKIYGHAIDMNYSKLLIEKKGSTGNCVESSNFAAWKNIREVRY
ncbi:hypothetical protein AGMMS49965_15130 [Bacteroidia bacterium]|nr:hypothetical protein AGMMS49965_15130 [Bacteroidia bacterium]